MCKSHLFAKWLLCFQLRPAHSVQFFLAQPPEGVEGSLVRYGSMGFGGQVVKINPEAGVVHGLEFFLEHMSVHFHHMRLAAGCEAFIAHSYIYLVGALDSGAAIK